MIPYLKLVGEPYSGKLGCTVRRGVVGKVLARQGTRWLPTLRWGRAEFSADVLSAHVPCRVSVSQPLLGRPQRW